MSSGRGGNPLAASLVFVVVFWSVVAGAIYLTLALRPG